ncbi:DUF1631 family protein [Dyella japonica]|uniref:DUF1631 family protein n=1 Tax=Dyella japonica TaxID=231455 RepID=A0ABV2K166_9GAMM
MIEHVQAMCASRLEGPLCASTDSFKRDLADLTKCDRYLFEGALAGEGLQKISFHCDSLSRSLLQNLWLRLSGLRTQEESTQTHDTMELLSHSDHERVVLIKRLAARYEKQNCAVLYELGHRLAWVFNTPPLEGEMLPIGPEGVLNAFAEAGLLIGLAFEHHLLLIEHFAAAVGLALPQLYEDINQYLRNQEIRSQGAQTTRRPMGSKLRQGALASEGAILRQDRCAGSEGSSPRTQAFPGPEVSLLTLLRSHRARKGRIESDVRRDMVGRYLRNEDLQQALSALDASGPAWLYESVEPTSTSLKEKLVSAMNTSGGSVRDIHLTDDQNDVLDLVTLLIDEMKKYLNKGSHAFSLLHGLQLPLLRLALADPGFLDDRNHPACKLLNRVAQVAEEWLDHSENDADRSLAFKLNLLVERARREQPSSGLYTSLLADIEHHLVKLDHRARTSERRRIGSAEGRERIEIARRSVGDLINERTDRVFVSERVRVFLTGAWANALAITLLRYGEDSYDFKEKMHATDQLVGLKKISNATFLRERVVSALTSVGMQEQEASDQAEEVLRDLQPAMCDTTFANKADEAARPQSIATQETLESQPPSATPDQQKLSTKETQVLDWLSQLPFGSQFEFVGDDGKTTHRRKLAWYSHCSGNALLLSPHGGRGEEMKLASLARHIVDGRVKPAAAKQASIIDRVWLTLTSKLRAQADTLHYPCATA